ncbi:hypothetical protein KGP36_00705 [Patescibacteria group bacterium]|nr:hypothetical protein [Patescibacteria group bacterium]
MKKMLDMAVLEADPTDRLCDRVMAKIERRELARLRRRTFGAGFFLIAALIGFIPAFQYLSSALALSGLGDYLSLFTSDSSYVFAHWSAFAMSVSDSLPVPAFMAVIGLSIVCLAAASRFVKYVSSIQSHERQLATVSI